MGTVEIHRSLNVYTKQALQNALLVVCLPCIFLNSLCSAVFVSWTATVFTVTRCLPAFIPPFSLYHPFLLRSSMILIHRFHMPSRWKTHDS